MPDPKDISLDSPEILDYLADYQTLSTDRRATVRAELLDRFPHLQTELRDCLDGLELLDGVAPLKTLQQDDEAISREDLGDFQLLREIGRGGMGVVYEARQRSLGRLVALKVLPFAAFLDRKRLERFKLEAQAAAKLRHPSIVNVFCVGCERSVHFYAMELIEGVNLADVIRDMQDSQQPIGRSDLSQRETQAIAQLTTQHIHDRGNYFRRVASIGAELADALHYAHARGVVHRDIKPSNILLDDQGKPWLTDFGLAQVQDDSSLTQTGDFLGTLRYMSPEQADGRHVLDARTDIYSLAATLYELLVLTPANSGKDQRELLNQLEESRPKAPRQLDAQIPIDLETILLHAMEPRPENRYRAAGELADDLRNFLAKRPIKARRSSRRHRAWRYVQRHPYVSCLAAALLIVLLSLAIAGPYLAWQFRNLAVEADRAKQHAEQTKNAVIEMLDTHTDTTFLAIENSPTNDVINSDLIADVLDQYEELLAIDPTNPKLKATVGHAYTQMSFAAGRFNLAQSDRVDGGQLSQRATHLFESLLQSVPDKVEYAIGLAESYRNQAAWLDWDDWKLAVELCDRGINVLTPFADRYPEHNKLLVTLSVCNYTKAESLRHGRNPEDRENAHRAAVQLGRRIYQRLPNPENRAWLAWLIQGVASRRQFEQRRISEAIPLYQEALCLYGEGYENTRLAERWRLGELSAKRALASCLVQQGDYQTAETVLDGSVDQCVLICEQFPAHGWPLSIAKEVLFTRVNLCLAQGHPDAAKTFIDRLGHVFAIDHHFQWASVSHLRYHQGRVAWLLGDKAVAREHFEESLTGELPNRFRAPAIVLCLSPSMHDGEQALNHVPEKYPWLRIAALARAGRDEEAVAFAEGRDDVDAAAFFLAMSYQRLGRMEQAQRCFESGSRQLLQKSSSDMNEWRPEFLAVQAEAERLLASGGESHFEEGSR